MQKRQIEQKQESEQELVRASESERKRSPHKSERIAPLVQADELALIARAQAGEAAAMAGLCHQYRPLVEAVGARYAFFGRDEVEQEGWLALVKAVHGYQTRVGVRFAGYATAVVRGDVYSMIRRERKYRDAASYQNASGLTEENGAGHALLRVIDPNQTEALVTAEWRAILGAAGLSPRERYAMEQVLRGRDTQGVALEQGVSIETVKTWRKRGVRKLRRYLGA